MFLDYLANIGSELDPSLNIETEYVLGGSLKGAREYILKKCKEADFDVTIIPSESAIYRACNGKAEEMRSNLDVSWRLTLKVKGIPHRDLEMLNKAHQNIRDRLFSILEFVTLWATDDLAIIDVGHLNVNKYRPTDNKNPKKAASSDMKHSPNRLVFTSWLILTPRTLSNKKRMDGKAQPLK